MHLFSLETEWKKEWFVKVPRSHWISPTNCRNAFDKLKLHFNIKEPEDWGKITIKEISKKVPMTILRKYKASLFLCLQAVYPGFQNTLFPNLCVQKYSGNLSGFQIFQHSQRDTGSQTKTEGNFSTK